MILTIEWKPQAISSYYLEMDFILLKWNAIEVQKFEDLVDEFLKTLSLKSEMGKYSTQYNCYSIVISKQTTLFYKILKDKNQLDLILFWNNAKNPNDLTKLL
ncbi:hypothetical protein [Flavobacterium sp.]|uniref:hypothetical protein n=1 Tax=Flavobacterium sp. TaxID=239 RepID=UPI00286C8B0F|nr:hypothetical protein [Flavobacterium sp.]